jgi:hypothetical protein
MNMRTQFFWAIGDFQCMRGVKWSWPKPISDSDTTQHSREAGDDDESKRAHVPHLWVLSSDWCLYGLPLVTL